MMQEQQGRDPVHDWLDEIGDCAISMRDCGAFGGRNINRSKGTIALLNSEIGGTNICSGFGGSQEDFSTRADRGLEDWEPAMAGCPRAGEVACAEVCQFGVMIRQIRDALENQ